MKLKLSFQIKKGHKNNYILMRLNFGVKDQKGKYISKYISTNLVSDTLEFDSKHPFNGILEAIKTNTYNTFKKYDSVKFKSNELKAEVIVNAIKKVVFGKEIPQEELFLTSDNILVEKQYQNTKAIEGDDLEILEKTHKITTVDRNKEEIRNMTFIKYIEYFQERRRKNNIGTESTIKTYGNLKFWIEKYNKEVKVKEINEDWVLEFFKWARKEKKDDGSNYSFNYINANLQKSLKAVINYLLNEDKIDLDISWKINGLKKQTEKSFEVSLSIEQIKIIKNLELKSKSEDSKLQLAKDYLIIGCLTGLRISDLKQLNLVKDQTGNYFVDQILQKPNLHVRFQVHPIVAEIYEKYNKNIPSIAESKLNIHIKHICEIAYKEGYKEFGHIIEVKRKNPDNPKLYITEKPAPFYSFIKTSSFRRTFATYAVSSGVMELSEICKVTGHKRIQQLLDYCQISDKDLSNKLSLLYKHIDL